MEGKEEWGLVKKLLRDMIGKQITFEYLSIRIG
jgi:hypothetical protein